MEAENAKSNEPKVPPAKREYRTPVLRHYGDVSALTKTAGPGVGIDGAPTVLKT